jgi:hypothetical protein
MNALHAAAAHICKYKWISAKVPGASEQTGHFLEMETHPVIYNSFELQLQIFHLTHQFHFFVAVVCRLHKKNLKEKIFGNISEWWSGNVRCVNPWGPWREWIARNNVWILSEYIPYKSVQHNGEDEKGHLCVLKYPMLELQGLNARSGEAAIYKSAKSAQMRIKIWRGLGTWKGRRRTKQNDELD